MHLDLDGSPRRAVAVVADGARDVPQAYLCADARQAGYLADELRKRGEAVHTVPVQVWLTTIDDDESEAQTQGAGKEGGAAAEGKG
ncbi:MAG TPA: hypothetical protein VFG73_02260 [Rhodanobacteraceae bacterium]|nr:hypothetical protein [Rhodanobacteraceae bacterium]